MSEQVALIARSVAANAQEGGTWETNRAREIPQMSANTPDDDSEWPSAEADFWVLASYPDAVARLQEFISLKAKTAGRRFRSRRNAAESEEDVLQECLRGVLARGKKLLLVQKPRGYVAKAVRNEAKKALRRGLVQASDEAASVRRPFELPEDLDQLLDVTEIIEGWYAEEKKRGRVLLTELRRESLQADCDLGTLMLLLGERAELDELAAHHEFSLLIRDLSIHLGRPMGAARWHLHSQDPAYFRKLISLIRLLVVRVGRADLFNLRGHVRPDAAEGALVRVRRGEGGGEEAPLVDVSEEGFSFLEPDIAGGPSVLDGFREDGILVFELVPPPGAAQPPRIVPGVLVAVDEDDAGRRWHVHLREPLDSRMLRCLNGGAV